jgi:predicted N-acetyltransferase YhbS
MDIQIRKEIPADYRRVEEITREAFWNLYVPGCDEHYLAHIMRNNEDFIQDYSLVAIEPKNDCIVGNIMYAKSTVKSDEGAFVNTINFGPVCVLPEYQNKGIGSKLIKTSIELAQIDHIPAIIIEGHPKNYCKHGFKSSFDYKISDVDGRYPFGLLVLELQKGIFEGKKWTYFRSPVYNNIDPKLVEEFDQGFPKREKYFKPSQEEFSIACRAYILDDN